MLRDVVKHGASGATALDVLVPLVVRSDAPVLQVLLRLLRVALDEVTTTNGGQKLAHNMESVLDPLAQKLQHASSDVRKCAVDCMVACYFATGQDPRFLAYLTAELDVTKRKLVEIFIHKRHLERQQVR